jgi:hypothetical protein
MNNIEEESDIQMLSLRARQAVIDVMERNQTKHSPGRWRELSDTDLIQHAVDHLSYPTFEDLENALVRIVMAMAQIENL